MSKTQSFDLKLKEIYEISKIIPLFQEIISETIDFPFLLRNAAMRRKRRRRGGEKRKREPRKLINGRNRADKRNNRTTHRSLSG